MLAHEAWLGQRVGSGGFVRVHERAENASALYIVFDWHGGRTLEQMRKSGARGAVAEVVSAAIEVTKALGRLHRHGVVHRDIKPGNLHLGDDGRWRILDLGVALSGREGAAQRELHAGTPSYINPEQWEGAEADTANATRHSVAGSAPASGVAGGGASGRAAPRSSASSSSSAVSKRCLGSRATALRTRWSSHIGTSGRRRETGTGSRRWRPRW